MEVPKASDFPDGPLANYRKQATFDWKNLRVRFFTPEMIQWREEVWSEINGYQS